MTKILLMGGTGQVGWELQRTLMGLGQVIVAGRQVSDASLRVDLSQADEICQLIQTVQPQLIVNAAAYTAVDQAETEPDLAMAINGLAPGIMAEAAQTLGAAMIHYSTDYVFDGTQASPYGEHDLPAPLNVYGKTKLAGERAIQAVGLPHLILRTSWVYGLRGKNFLLTMLRLAQEREVLKIVDDQIGSPTWCRMIAETTAQILAQGIADLLPFLERHQGIYHLTATGETSWYTFAKTIFEQTQNADNRILKEIIPIPTAAYPTPAQRPQHSTLITQKISDAFSLHLPAWEKSLALALDT